MTGGADQLDRLARTLKSQGGGNNLLQHMQQPQPFGMNPMGGMSMTPDLMAGVMRPEGVLGGYPGMDQLQAGNFPGMDVCFSRLR